MFGEDLRSKKGPYRGYKAYELHYIFASDGVEVEKTIIL